MRLNNEVALITGGGSGMGRAGAIRFAAEGARVVVVDINQQAAEETRDLIAQAGGEAIAVRADAASAADNEAAVAAAIERFGKLTIVWANAGIPAPATPIEETAPETFDRLFAVNSRGPWLAARAAAPALREAGGGSIVITASLSGLKGRPGNSAYASSKGAAAMLTKALAVEFAPDIRVNSVCPVATDTPMLPEFTKTAPDPDAARDKVVSGIPMKRLATADDIANAALFLASSEAAMITGHNLPVDGGSLA
ncbi:glucose 1-dehydrogenase [Microbacterium sp.]|uniref:glucose 1-dehydrogenase n=1 Tax=Microbacterium sp. TaxID=51671 RepID=UPI002CB16ADA|nr:glucose 1-dehydrogenase [Microbacterium sp.]HWL76514.1 glucose 1-dehydrogenase [Microbacterium sp.]HWV56627.1 glucose 1-dehydrogenase [Longimicrobiales bacterium]